MSVNLSSIASTSFLQSLSQWFTLADQSRLKCYNLILFFLYIPEDKTISYYFKPLIFLKVST